MKENETQPSESGQRHTLQRLRENDKDIPRLKASLRGDPGQRARATGQVSSGIEPNGTCTLLVPGMALSPPASVGRGAGGREPLGESTE